MDKKIIVPTVVLFIVSWIALAVVSVFLVNLNTENQKLKEMSLIFEKKSKLTEEEFLRFRQSQKKADEALDHLQWRFMLQEQVYDAGNRLKIELNKIKDLKKNKEITSLLYYNLGLNLVLAADFDSALKAFQEAVKVNPKDAESYHNLGLLYSAYLQDNKKAVDNYKKYLELTPSSNPKARGVKERVEELGK